MKEEKNMETMKEATAGNVVKLEFKNDFISGIFLGYEPSHQYPSSFALTTKDKNENKVVFVSGIVIDLIRKNNIQPGNEIKVVFQGKKKTLDGKRDYNDYKVFYA